MINFVNIFITPPKTFQFDLGVAGKEILTLSALYRSCQFLPLSDRTKVLETLKFNLSHTAKHIADALLKVAENWDISSKVVDIDNASNIVAAVKITGWTNVPCFAHTLNLVVSEAITSDENIRNLTKRCKQIITFFHQSVKGTEKLKEVQCQIKLNQIIKPYEMPDNERFAWLKNVFLILHHFWSSILPLNSLIYQP